MKWLVRFSLLFVTMAAVAAAGWYAVERLRPVPLAYSTPPAIPEVLLDHGQVKVATNCEFLYASVSTQRDELLAYLEFQYLRGLGLPGSSDVLLTVPRTTFSDRTYRVGLVVENDLLRTIPHLSELKARGFINSFDIRCATRKNIEDKRAQTAVFLGAYNFPVRKKLENLSHSKLRPSVERFILFKSRTDRRVRAGIQPVPPELSPEQASELASDIIEVSRFYSLPLDFFLGIGAMENNYMNVRGDLEHAVWKRRIEPGDIVLKRRRGRVLVSNYAIGMWQITRETLRYAHKLYLKDSRDYSRLSPRLRPGAELEFDSVDSHKLTTYAGLFFRDLLDRFDGDAALAAGAYNGGVANPNLGYTAGARAAANHARKVIEQMAALDGHPVTQTRFFMPGRQ